jgi:transposase
MFIDDKKNFAHLAHEAELSSRIKVLEEQIAYLMRKQFGQSSEQSKVNNSETTAESTDDTGVFSQPESTGQQTETTAPSAHKKKRSSRQKKISPTLPVHEQVYELDQLQCDHCQHELTRIGRHFVREQVQFIPAQLYLEKTYQATYKCLYCSHDTATDGDIVVQAPVPLPVISHSLATPSLMAEIIHNKFELAVPLYRQTADWHELGLSLSEPTLANWMINAAGCLAPLVKLCGQELLTQKHIHGDETTCQVLREPNKPAKSKSYLWLRCSSNDAKQPVILFDYAPSRSGATAQQLYQDYQGTLVCDGYAGYNQLSEKIQRAGCWAHVRRKFFEAQRDGGPHGHGKAVEAVTQLDQLFGIEADLANTTPTERDQVRQQRCRPLVDHFFIWLNELKALPQSKLGHAVAYAKHQAVALKRFLSDPLIALSNNIAERQIKLAVMGRKNWLFSTSRSGAKANALLLSLVLTAKANHLNVRKYLNYLLKELPQLGSLPNATELAAYLPWQQVVQSKCR